MLPELLLVDDSEFIQALIASICARHGWDFRHADSVATGTEALTERQPDVLVLDFHLPDGRGVELVRRVTDRAHTKVLGLSMQPREYARKRYADEGVDLVLDKETVLRHELEAYLVQRMEGESEG